MGHFSMLEIIERLGKELLSKQLIWPILKSCLVAWVHIWTGKELKRFDNIKDMHNLIFLDGRIMGGDY